MTNQRHPKSQRNYLIRFRPAMDGSAWLPLADAFEAYLWACGYEPWEFNTKEIDRDYITARQNLDCFEGFIADGTRALDQTRFCDEVVAWAGGRGLEIIDVNLSDGRWAR